MGRKKKTGLTPAKRPRPVDPARVEQTLVWLLSGHRDQVILNSIRAEWPDQDINQLIEASIDQLRESSVFDADAVIGFVFEATKDLYRKMVEIGDLNGALKALKQLNDLAAKHGREPPPDDDNLPPEIEE